MQARGHPPSPHPNVIQVEEGSNAINAKGLQRRSKKKGQKNATNPTGPNRRVTPSMVQKRTALNSGLLSRHLSKSAKSPEP